MKCPIIIVVLLAALHFSASAQQTVPQAPNVQPTRTSRSQIAHSQGAYSQSAHSPDTRLAKQWGLRDDEFARYRELMEGPLGIYSPKLDPLSALGVEARSEEERRRYAELQVQAEARRVEKLLAYQRAYDQAWQRINPGMQRVNLPDDKPDAVTVRGSGRTAVFIVIDRDADLLKRMYVEARIGNRAKAGQVIGNFNNLFMLRVRETATAELLTRQLPKVEVYTTTIVSGATDSSDIRGATDFTSNTQDRISMSSVPMIEPSHIVGLPKGQCFALLQGGQLWKIRMPLPTPDADEVMPQDLQQLAGDMSLSV